MSSLKSLAGAQLEGISVKKVCGGANEFEFSGGELFSAVIGEFLNQAILASHDFWKVKSNTIGNDAPGFGMTRKVHDFSGEQKGLGRHATTKDAEPGDFLGAFDDDGAKARSGCGASGGITSAAAPDDSQIEVDGTCLRTH